MRSRSYSAGGGEDLGEHPPGGGGVVGALPQRPAHPVEGGNDQGVGEDPRRPHGRERVLLGLEVLVFGADPGVADHRCRWIVAELGVVTFFDRLEFGSTVAMR